MFEIECKGYPVSSGYMGWIGYRYMLFASENDYRDWIHPKEETDDCN